MDQATKTGATPLYIAAGNGHTAVAEALIREAGSNIGKDSWLGYRYPISQIRARTSARTSSTVP